MKRIFKGLFCILFSFLVMFSNIITPKAASATISVSSSTSKVVIGNTVTFTVKISSSASLGAWEWTINYDSSRLKLISGETKVAGVYTDSKTYTYKFKTLKTGSAKVSLSAVSALSMDEKNLTVNKGSKTISVITQAQLEASYSSNNNLKSLSIDGLTLTPAFSSNVTDYKAQADSNTQSINVKASVEDSKADISGTGKYDVSEGENKIKINVTAENGKTKTYTILVNVIDPNPIKVNIGNEEFVLVKRESNLTMPDGFEKTSVDIQEQKVPGFYNELNGFTLIGLKDINGDIGLYVYDKNNNTYEKYTEVNLDQIKLFPLSINKSFLGEYNKDSVVIDDVKFDALKLKNSKYAIIHAKDLVSGKDNYYKYDEVNESLIIYTDEELKPLYAKIDEYKKIIMLLSIETIFVFLVLIFLLISRVVRNSKRKKLLERQLLKQKELKELENQNNIEEETKSKRGRKKKS